RLRSLGDSDRKLIIEKGGIDNVQEAIPELKSTVTLAETVGRQKRDPFNGVAAEASEPNAEDAWDLARGGRWKQPRLLRTKEEAPRGRLQRAEAIVARANPTADDYSLGALFKLWVRVREPIDHRKHSYLIGLLRSVIGDVPYNEINLTHIVRYR